jgi:hypothetical protein
MGQGSAQVVSDVARHLAQILEQGRDAIEHRVDGVGETIQLVVTAAQGNAVVEPARDDGIAGFVMASIRRRTAC